MGGWAAALVAGDIGAAIFGADAERKGRHEAAGKLEQSKTDAIKYLQDNYSTAMSWESSIDDILNTHYKGIESGILQSFDEASGQVAAGFYRGRGEISRGYEEAGKETIVGFDEAGRAIKGSYGKAREQFSQWKTSGENADKVMADLNGLNGPEAQAAAYSRVQYDPGYRARVDQANQALQRSGLSAGNIFSGNFANSVLDLNQKMASNEFGNYYSRLMGMSQQGEQAAGSTANLFSREGDLLSNLSTSRAGALSSLALSKGKSLSDLDIGLGTALSDLSVKRRMALTGAETDYTKMLTGVAQNKAQLAANTGTTLANISIGQGTQLANLDVLGGQQTADMYSGIASGVGAGAGMAYQDRKYNQNQDFLNLYKQSLMRQGSNGSGPADGQQALADYYGY